MPQFFVIRKRQGEDNRECDVESAESLEALVASLKEKDVFGEERDYYEENHECVGGEESETQELLLVPLEAAIPVDLQSVRDEHNRKVAEWVAAAAAEKERADYERLKAKFGAGG